MGLGVTFFESSEKEQTGSEIYFREYLVTHILTRNWQLTCQAV